MDKNNNNNNKPNNSQDHEHCPNCCTPKEKNSTGDNFYGTPGHKGEQKYFPSLENDYDDSYSDETSDEFEEIPEEYL